MEHMDTSCFSKFISHNVTVHMHFLMCNYYILTSSKPQSSCENIETEVSGISCLGLTRCAFADLGSIPIKVKIINICLHHSDQHQVDKEHKYIWVNVMTVFLLSIIQDSFAIAIYPNTKWTFQNKWPFLKKSSLGITDIGISATSSNPHMRYQCYPL